RSQNPEGETKISASEVSKAVFGEFGVEISQHTIQHGVTEDEISVSPKKKGPEGVVPRLIYDNLCNAFESYIQIKQLNGHATGITNKKLFEQLKKRTRSDCNHLLHCLLKYTALEPTSGRSNNVEEPHERDLLELGEVDSDEKTVLPAEELKKIINIDETCLVLDRSKCNRGGMNLKGGMDEKEFRSYFLNSIVPLFLDAQDAKRMRLIMKVDSDPGRMEVRFSA
ncbi:hypothetical protein ACHAW6_013421, partial [Cyclotella cf. meneghiniana]